jgi:signal peptidase
MKKDIKLTYIFNILLLLILIIAALTTKTLNNKILAIILIIFSLILNKYIKKKNQSATYEKQIILFMLGFAILYLVAFYIMGFYFGYYTNPIPFNFNNIINNIIPISIIIITTEIIRTKLILEKSKPNKIINLICMILIDSIIYLRIYQITSYNDFITLLGLIIFSSIANNLLFNYISKSYGYKPIIIYKLITLLYSYIIPIIPDVLVFFRSILRMIYPYIIYLVLEYSYSKEKYAISNNDKKKNIIHNSILIIGMLFIVMLISCKFSYGIIVIGSGSMTGTLNTGDAILYEAYDNQTISNKDIIVFYKNDVKTIHRVINIVNSNGEIRYFTKGDANIEADEGYITSKDIIGISKIKLKYVGYPSIWLRDIFK